MAISVTTFTGSETVTTTEWSLTADSSVVQAQTTVGVFQAFLDVNALAAGDTYEFRTYEKARAADTQRLCYVSALSGPQGYPIFTSPSLILGAGWDMTIIKTAGTDRTITWSIRSVSS